MKKKYWKRKIISLTVVLSLVSITSKILAETVPMVGAFAGKAAIVSASLSLPEGGNSILYPEIENSKGDEETGQLVIDKSDYKKDFTTNQATSKQDIDSPPKTNFSEEQIAQFPENNGPIIRKHYQAGFGEQYINIGGLAYVRNMTNLPNQVVIDANNSPPAFNLDKSKDPQVLIMHTHTTESYELTEKDYYDNNFPTRSKDTSVSVVRVGEEITKGLQQAGINAIHNTTIHDDPAYNGAYNRSSQTIQEILKEYPSIKVVLDIHRDAISTDAGERYAPIADINGKNASQIMIISGCDDGTMNFPNYSQNLSFACLLQKQTEADYPGLTRPISFKYKHYNQSLTPGSLLIEFGGHANSVDEAIYAGWLFGKSLARALQTIQN
ncbi:MAG: stage II sporulation protein P [Oscillospiraceae bacterium]|nr:stage II sporulation protein P [Oscillospiraceae bacterium]